MFEFMKEYEIMQSIEHANVVKLFGVVLETSKIMLITELAPLRFDFYCISVIKLKYYYDFTAQPKCEERARLYGQSRVTVQ
jgi:hypothetical protein